MQIGPYAVSNVSNYEKIIIYNIHISIFKSLFPR